MQGDQDEEKKKTLRPKSTRYKLQILQDAMEIMMY